MTHFEQAIARTRKAQKHLENALEDLKANKHKYHPRTYRILEEPLVEEIQLRQKEINEYLWQLDPQPTGVAVRDPEPDGPPADEVSEPLPVSERPNTQLSVRLLSSIEVIGSLPRWARVAFGTRCVRRVMPLLRSDWPQIPANELEMVLGTLKFAERVASLGKKDLAYETMMNSGVVDAAHHVAVRAKNFNKPQASKVAVLAAIVLRAAHQNDDAKLNELISGAVNGAAELLDPRAWRYIQSDHTNLAFVTDRTWTDDTPVPPSVFGPLWPDGPPAGWPEDENPDRDLVLEIDLPDDATDADVKRYVELLVNKADDVYRAGGGNGLKISGLDITGDKLVAKPSPDSTQPSEELVGGAT